MTQAQTVADLKDTGVTVAPDAVVNEILPFCAQGQVGRDLLSQADYGQDMQRNIGHQPGIARAQLANKQARQVSHMAAGLAQCLARRFAPGVVDDGDLDKVEAALVGALDAVIKSPAHLATLLKAGLMQPDGVTTTVDDDGLLTALGGNLQINSDDLIEESCEWTAPVSGWFKVLIVDGGASGWAGGDSINARALGGRSGARKWHTAYFRKGDKIDVIVGAGGVISASANNPVSGSGSYFGSLSSGGGLAFYNTSSPNMAIKSFAFLDAPGAGPGGGSSSPGSLPTTAGYHYVSNHNGYRGGGGGSRIYNQSVGLIYTVGNGGNGYIHIMWHDPAKAAGPVVAPVLLAARRMAAPRAADAPVTVNLYDPETGQGSVWREEDAEAKLAEGLISESAWMEIRAARAAEERAEWLTSPATSAERFAMLRAAREVRLAEYDTAVAQLRREERAGENVIAALAAWDAYAEV